MNVEAGMSRSQDRKSSSTSAFRKDRAAHGTTHVNTLHRNYYCAALCSLLL
jgi:hypothetical protein